MNLATVLVRCQQLFELFKDEEGQAVSEYAVMLAVIMVLVITSLWHIATNASRTFIEVGSQIR
ncbi:MAG TPA: hypothetical protein VFA89_12840 [Terriglobales bacterium]|nr:hypothetical protein [Terriglobales bacterium]